MTPETLRKIPHKSEHSPKRDGDEGARGNNTTPALTTHDNENTKTDTPGSPKRNKKLKTDRNDEKTHERNRSLTRSAANRGKL
jgi:hypothetical protein